LEIWKIIRFDIQAGSDIESACFISESHASSIELFSLFLVTWLWQPICKLPLYCKHKNPGRTRVFIYGY